MNGWSDFGPVWDQWFIQKSSIRSASLLETCHSEAKRGIPDTRIAITFASFLPARRPDKNAGKCRAPLGPWGFLVTLRNENFQNRDNDSKFSMLSAAKSPANARGQPSLRTPLLFRGLHQQATRKFCFQNWAACVHLAQVLVVGIIVHAVFARCQPPQLNLPFPSR